MKRNAFDESELAELNEIRPREMLPKPPMAQNSVSKDIQESGDLKCHICGYALIKTTTQETGWQQYVCPNIGKNNSLGHDIVPIGHLKPIEQKPEIGRQTNRATALNIFMRSNDWLKSRLADNPHAQCGCGCCSLCAYRYFESLPNASHNRVDGVERGLQPSTESSDVEMEVARQVVMEWSSLFMGQVANEATYENLIKRIAPAIRKAKESAFDAGLEEGAKIVEVMKGGYTASVDEDILVPDEDGPWILPSECAAAIRARISEKHSDPKDLVSEG